MEKRAVFDFEIDFLNGGGIQGQGFRLDIDGDEISDRDLGDAIVRDLRLLMVGDIRILNKRIVDEPHKRSPARNAGKHDSHKPQYIDLSHTVYEGLITYKGLPAPLICDFLSREASREYYAEGTSFQIGRIDMMSNTGTSIVRSIASNTAKTFLSWNCLRWPGWKPPGGRRPKYRRCCTNRCPPAPHPRCAGIRRLRASG
jgi:hypothetical protein